VNINMLNDSHDDGGITIAMCATSPTATWIGAELYESTDGTSYTKVANIPNEATMGYTTNVLGNFYGGNIPDELSSVNIILSNGTLSSTDHAGLLSGTNMCVIGREIMYYRTSTVESNGSVTLRGFLRGQRGSEYAMSEHAIGERFVLVTSTLVRVAKETSAIGTTRQYKAISVGGGLSSAEAKSFTNEGAGKKPLAPVHLGGGRDASGNLTIKWTRRGRIDGVWRDLVDVPVSESTESYTIEIYSDATYTVLKRTVEGLTSQTYEYSAADQTTDFGAPQSTVYFKVYQLSAVVGRGYVASGNV
jgi:hypothetical protein